MKNNLIEQYMQRAEQIIGKRTDEEIAHDAEVITGLEMGLPIKAALSGAAQKYPSEALQWAPDTINDIAAHYDYMKEHYQILKLIQGKKPKKNNRA